MQVRLVRSGGLAGLNMVATVDAADLPADQQGVASRLVTEDVRGPGVSRPGVSRPGVSRPGGPDQFSYDLEIQHGERTVRRHWEELEVPESVRPLLVALMLRAKPAR